MSVFYSVRESDKSDAYVKTIMDQATEVNSRVNLLNAIVAEAKEGGTRFCVVGHGSGTLYLRVGRDIVDFQEEFYPALNSALAEHKCNITLLIVSCHFGQVETGWQQRWPHIKILTYEPEYAISFAEGRKAVSQFLNKKAIIIKGMSGTVWLNLAAQRRLLVRNNLTVQHYAAASFEDFEDLDLDHEYSTA